MKYLMLTTSLHSSNTYSLQIPPLLILYLPLGHPHQLFVEVISEAVQMVREFDLRHKKTGKSTIRFV